MFNFSQWIDEAKKKSRPDSKNQDTAVSAPIKGANQDRSGEGVSHDTADYTISDAKVCPACGKNPCKCVKEAKTPAWSRKEGKNPEGGLNRKGIASYRAEHPGSKLSLAVTTKPSKLKPGSKAVNRRKSFCARMGGMKGPMKDEKGRPTRKALSLRKWNCHEDVIESTAIAGVGDMRSKPVNMAQSTGGSKALNAPANVSRMQNAANQRVAQLDKMSQQNKDEQEKNRENEIKQRTMAASKDKVGNQMKKDTQAEGYIHIGPADGSSPFGKWGDKKPGTRTLGNDSKREKRDVEPRSPVKKNINDRLTTTREEVEHIIEVIGDHAGLAKYADEHGRLDTDDLHTAAKHMKDHNMGALRRHLQNMDTDPRDKALEYVNKKHYAKLGYSAEEVEYVDEISKKTAMSAYQSASYVDGEHPKQDKIRGHIEKKWGKEMGKHADDHAHSSNYGRNEPGKTSGEYFKHQDKLTGSDKTKAGRVTKSGVMNKSDQKYNASAIKKRIGSHTKPNLPEEVEYVDELSKKTLGSYINKAVVNKGMNDRYSAGKPKGDKESDKVASQRASGIKMAVKRLAKEEVEYVDEASSAMKSLASKKKSGTERAHKETHGISSKRFAVRQIDKSKPVKHKVDVHVVTDKGVERKYQDVVHAKDKHSAIFQTQRKYAEFGKKMGYSIDKVVHKGMVKEEVDGIDEASKATVASYSYKAGRQVTGNQPSDPDKLRKRNNREQGLKLAYNKFYGNKVKVPATEEVAYVDEAKKESEARDLGDRHIIMQARKVISTRGASHITFADGKTHAVNPMTAHKLIAKHDSLAKPADKEAFAAHAHSSLSGMKDAMAGKKPEVKPAISLGGSKNVGGIRGPGSK